MNIPLRASECNFILDNSKAFLKRYRDVILGVLVAGYLAGPAVISYRGLYSFSDELFKKVTLGLVNNILSNPNISNKITPNTTCILTEGNGGNTTIVCKEDTVSFNMPPHNTALYKCFDLKLDEDKQLNTSSGYCFRGSIINNEVVYHDSNGNPINKDFIPGKHYPIDYRTNQG